MTDSKISQLTEATAIADADLHPVVQNVSTTPVTRAKTGTIVKAWLKTYFDTLYQAIVAPGANGNVLTSNGSIWQSAAPTGGGGGSPSVCDGRLTLESGVPVSVTDQTAKTTIYFTPFVGNKIGLYNGATWNIITFAELSLSLAGFTANRPYDIFVYNNSGTAALEALAWTSATARATAIAKQDGIDVKSGAATRRLLGTILITGTTGQCEQSKVFLGISNRYNQVRANLFANPGLVDNSTNTSYTVASTTWVELNGGTGSRINFVLCQPQAISIFGLFGMTGAAGGTCWGAIGLDTIVTPNQLCFGLASYVFITIIDSNKGAPLAVGSHYAALLGAYAAVSPASYLADVGGARNGGSTDPCGTNVSANILY